jgi:hypothetical protein
LTVNEFAKRVGVVCGAVVSAGVVLGAIYSLTVAGPLRQERAERIASDSVVVAQETARSAQTWASVERLERFAEYEAVLKFEPPGSPEYRKAQENLRGLVRYRISP